MQQDHSSRYQTLNLLRLPGTTLACSTSPLPTIDSLRSLAKPPRGTPASRSQHPSPSLSLLSLALGASAVMFASRPLEHWSLTIIDAHLDLRSVFLAAVFLFVLLIIGESNMLLFLASFLFRFSRSLFESPSSATTAPASPMPPCPLYTC